MKLVDDLKRRIGETLLYRKVGRLNVDKNSFSDFFTTAIDVLILLPEDEPNFTFALDVARFFKIHKKNVTLIIPEFKKNLLANNFDYNYLTINVDSQSGLGFAEENLLKSISKNYFDIYIDLNETESLFYSSISLQVKAKFKIALFKRSKSEKIYNLLFDENTTNFENSCRNLLNSIQMF